MLNPQYSINSPASLFLRHMAVTTKIQDIVSSALTTLYQQPFSAKDFQINQTKPEFEGDYTVVLFSLVKQLKKAPDVLGNELGSYLIKQYPDFFSAHNIIKGFLNLTINDSWWIELLQHNYTNSDFGKKL
jgi:arginyl-tRNA synthetase